jgi:hypothetical protein
MGGLAGKTVGLWRQYSRSPRSAWPRRRPGTFEVGYVTEDGAEHRVRLDEAWLVPLERALPVRRFGARKGQRRLSGLWWSATTGGMSASNRGWSATTWWSATDGRHIGYESWLERDQLMWLDWDRAVTGTASQPFRLRWTTEEGEPRSHVPDYFAERGRPGYQPAGTADAIAHWMKYDSWQPPGRPHTTFPQTRRYLSSPARAATTSRQSLQRHERSTLWFRPYRRGGRVILHHGPPTERKPRPALPAGRRVVSLLCSWRRRGAPTVPGPRPQTDQGRLQPPGCGRRLR